MVEGLEPQLGVPKHRLGYSNMVWETPKRTNVKRYTVVHSHCIDEIDTDMHVREHVNDDIV